MSRFFKNVVECEASHINIWLSIAQDNKVLDFGT